MTDETYEGWTNRETWAVALHINNDQGWQESVHYALRGWAEENRPGVAFAALDLTEDALQAGYLIRENVEELLDPEGELWGRDLSKVAQDIGSLWRVNWTELGAAFLSDLEDE